MESELLMLNLFMGIMATLLLAMDMVLAMADMVMESELLMLNLFMGIMATLLLAMVMVLAMVDMVMESELLMVILFMGILATLLMVLNISCSLQIFKDHEQGISKKSPVPNISFWFIM